MHLREDYHHRISSLEAQLAEARAEVERMRSIAERLVEGCVRQSYSEWFWKSGFGEGVTMGWADSKLEAMASVRDAVGLVQGEEAPHA